MVKTKRSSAQTCASQLKKKKNIHTDKWPERKVKAYLIKLLNKSGLLWWRNQSAAGYFNGRFMKAGCPGLWDICAVTAYECADKVTFIECKATGKQLSKNQEEFRCRIGERAVAWRVVDSKKSSNNCLCFLLDFFLFYTIGADGDTGLYDTLAKGLLSGGIAGWKAARTRVLDTLAAKRAQST